jgi:hypothetical protein
MWRGEVRRGRAGQAFDFGEPGVLDGATAKSLAAGSNPEILVSLHRERCGAGTDVLTQPRKTQ